MNVETTRFGTLEIDEESIIKMPRGMLGFDEYTRYITIQHRADTAFRWLQCVDEPALAFVVVDPSMFTTDYDFEISDADAEKLELTGEGDAFVLAVVNISNGGRDITLNLAAPVVVNSKNMKGMQVILQDSRYSIKHPLVKDATSESEMKTAVKAA
ncbi:MAG: flagellar assembly protein FliW [Armatimonadota bacterium]|nr:flagellar assembly protein FliW [bacterium]